MDAVWKVPEDRADGLYHHEDDDCRSLFAGTTVEQQRANLTDAPAGTTEHEDCGSCGATLIRSKVIA